MKNKPTANDLKILVSEYSKRKGKPFRIEEFCFSQQLAFINDSSRFKTAVCSRRAGKSVVCAADLVNTCLNNDKVTCLYITLTRNNAKKLVWKEVLDINKEYVLGGKPNNNELCITFKNGSMIYFAGASKKEEIEKFRGLSIKLVYIDEAQSFKPYIQELIDEVLSFATTDVSGKICLIGTPGPVPAGYFYNAAHSKGWSNHKWTIFDNPHIKIKSGRNVKEILKEDMDRRGITETDPVYLREALGQWVQDTDILVYKYNAHKNDFRELPDFNDLIFVLGIDLGYDDADAIAVMAYSKTEKKSYLVEELITHKQGITDLSKQIKYLINKYNPVKVKIDSGALGKKIAEELTKRHGIPLSPAEKNRKYEFIELLNDDLRTGRLKIRESSTCAQDYMKIQWDVLLKDRRTISDNFHSDIADAVLYAWRECLHYASEKREVPRYSDHDKVTQFWEKEAKKVEARKLGTADWWDDADS